VCYSRPTVYAYVGKFRLNRFILSPNGGEKAQILLLFFGLWHFVVSPVGGNLRKLNMGAQLQNFPYPSIKSSVVAEMRDRLATIDMGRKVGRGYCGGAGSPMGHRLTQCGLGRDLSFYQVAP